MDLAKLYPKVRAIYDADSSNTKALRLSRTIRRRILSIERGGRGLPFSRNPREPHHETYHSHFVHLQKALRFNRPIMSFDLEWDMDNPVTEIGLSILHNGTISSHNIHIFEDRAPMRRFRFGETVYMPVNEAAPWLLNHLQSAELVLGHAIKNDRDQIKKLGYIPEIKAVIDTAKWSRGMNNGMDMKLKRLLKYYGGNPAGAHVAGNDSRFIMEVMVRIMRQARPNMGWDDIEL